MKPIPRQASWRDLTVLPDIFQVCFQKSHWFQLVSLSLCGGSTAEQTHLPYCDPNLALIMKQNLIPFFFPHQEYFSSLFMKYSTKGSSCGTPLRCEDETKHQSLHSISGSSGMTVFTRSSKHHSAPLTSESEHYIMAGKSSKRSLWCMRVNFTLAEKALQQQWFSSAYGGQFGTEPTGHVVFELL